MAEREGFEPSRGANPCRFSRPVQSTALPPLRLVASLHQRRCAPSCRFYGGHPWPPPFGSAPAALFENRSRRFSSRPVQSTALPPLRIVASLHQRRCAPSCRFYGGHPWPPPFGPAPAALFEIAPGDFRQDRCIQPLCHLSCFFPFQPGALRAHLAVLWQES